MKLTPEELEMLSPEEAAVLQGADADTHLATMGDTVMGAPPKAEPAEVESDSTEGEEGAEDQQAEQAADDGNEGSTTDQAAAPEGKPEAKAEVPSPAPTQAPAPFKVPDVAELAAKRGELRTSKRDLLAKWTAGELSDEEYGEQVDKIDDELADIVAAQSRAATLQEVNTQNQERARAEAEAAENAAMYKVAVASKAAGLIDYQENKVAAAQFDSLFTAAKMDPANAKLSADDIVAKTHKAVLALHGLAEQPKAAAPAPAAPAPRPAPPSIGGLPNASPTVVQDELFERFRTLEGDDAEQFLAGLSDKQVERLMRISDGRGITH